MYKNFKLTESEKKQILEQHGRYGYKKPLKEIDIYNYYNDHKDLILSNTKPIPPKAADAVIAEAFNKITPISGKYIP